MENKLSKLFEELSADESLEIDAGAFASVSAAVNPGFILCYGIGIGIGIINTIVRLLK